ncbi:MAG: hypothetical protein IPK72_16270 [Candidatus Eisenbacteria bacterium]|nr:hypothetical protein [Candidatus Eisenbacteria bacterium]
MEEKIALHGVAAGGAADPGDRAEPVGELLGERGDVVGAEELLELPFVGIDTVVAGIFAAALGVRAPVEFGEEGAEAGEEIGGETATFPDAGLAGIDGGAQARTGRPRRDQ